MTKSSDISNLGYLAKSLLDKTDNGQEFMLEDVCNLTRSAYNRYPEDPVISQVAYTIEKIASKSPSGATISQAKISDIYNQLVRLSSNSKFRDVLGFLLLNDAPSYKVSNEEYTKANRIDAEVSKLQEDDFVDRNLVDAISVAFGGSFDTNKAYDNRIAKKGLEFVKAELQALGFDGKNIEVMAGNTDNIVYLAHFDTRKGRVSVAIPTEINNDKVLFPSTFVADNCLKELTSSNLSYFIDKKAESNDFTVPRAGDVLSAVGVIAGKTKVASKEEFDKLTDLFGKEEGSLELASSNLYVDREFKDPKPYIDATPKAKMPQAIAHLARDFEDSVLEAASSFGMEAIRKGKEIVAQELISAGFKNAQVKFGSEGNDSIIYLAAINTPKGVAEIEVPVEMQPVGEKYVPLSPSYFAYDGLIEDFTASKLQRFAISLPEPSSRNTAYSSSYAYMTLPELKDEILKAASVNDYVTCELVLDEIQDKFAEEDFKNAVADYHFLLMQKTKIAKQEQKKCSKMIPAGKGSIYARCGHFGVPMHKVVVDEQGNCRLKSAIEKEKLNPTEEGGAAISSAKVFMS